MHIDICFTVDNDIDNKYYDAILAALADNYNWHRKYDDMIWGDIPGMDSNDICLSRAYDMFVTAVQGIADKYAQSIHIGTLFIAVNFIARIHVPGQKIECGNVKEHKNILVNPME